MDLFEDIPDTSSNDVANSPGKLLHNNHATNTFIKPISAELSKGTNDHDISGGLSLYEGIPTQGSVQMPAAPAANTEIGKRKLQDKEIHQTEKKQKTVKFEIEPFLAERQGEREDMQDAHLILKDFKSHFADLDPSIYRLSVYGVFDGHGGTRASKFASENLHKNLREKFPKGDMSQIEKDIKKTFIDAFKKTDEDFLKEAAKSKPVWKDGTTAIIVLIINEMMYIANIGDSQAVLCRHKEETNQCTAISLSIPHNPSLYDERMRIQKQGGHVKDGRVMGVLEVSRSIGDGQYKKLGVTCTPDIKKCQLTSNDRYVIVACDGLWKCFDPNNSITFVNNILKDDSTKDAESKLLETKYEIACNKLANEAVLQFSGDNVTVCILAIKENR